MDFCKPEVLVLHHIVGVPLKPDLYDTDIVNAGSIALFIATLMVVGAIVIANITIFQLRIHQGASFTLVETAGIISLAFSGSIITMGFMAFIIGFFSPKLKISLRRR